MNITFIFSLKTASSICLCFLLPQTRKDRFENTGLGERRYVIFLDWKGQKHLVLVFLVI